MQNQSASLGAPLMLPVKRKDPRRRSFYQQPDTPDRNLARRKSTSRALPDYDDEFKTPRDLPQEKAKRKKTKVAAICPTYLSREFKPSENVTTLQHLIGEVLEQECDSSKKVFEAGDFAFVASAISDIVQTALQLNLISTPPKVVPHGTTALRRHSIDAYDKFLLQADEQIRCWEQMLEARKHEHERKTQKHEATSLTSKTESQLLKYAQTTYNIHSIRNSQMLQCNKTVETWLSCNKQDISSVHDAIHEKIFPPKDTKALIGDFLS